jgi:hypothetical protein
MAQLARQHRQGQRLEPAALPGALAQTAVLAKGHALLAAVLNAIESRSRQRW